MHHHRAFRNFNLRFSRLRPLILKFASKGCLLCSDLLLDYLEDSVLHIVRQLCLVESILEESLCRLEIFAVSVGSWAQNLH